jgi:hypothetical protein
MQCFVLLATIVSFGGSLEDYPHPELSFKEFARFIAAKNEAAGTTWDPIEKKERHWVDTKTLASVYQKSSCTLS